MFSLRFVDKWSIDGCRTREREADRGNKEIFEKKAKKGSYYTTGYILTTLISREDRIALLIPMVKIVNQRLVLNQASMNSTQASFTLPLSFVAFAECCCGGLVCT